MVDMVFEIEERVGNGVNGALEHAVWDGVEPEDRGRHYIEIRGARQHNLKNIDLKLPRDKRVVITGLSGSGKSSLAFDTFFFNDTAPTEIYTLSLHDALPSSRTNR